MPVGTVRGRFELDAPALRTLRDLERQGIRTQTQMKRLADQMDRVGGQEDVQHLRAYNQELGNLRRNSERTHRAMRAEWVATTRVVRLETQRQVRSIRELERALDRLAARTARPTIRVSGSAESMAEIAAAQTALGHLGTRTARPTINTVAGGGGPRPPVTGSMPRVLTGGGGGRRGGGLLDFGNVGLRPRNAAILGAAAYAPALLGGAGAVAGSAGMAALGAGAIGVAGGAGLLGGVAGNMLVGKAAVGKIGEAQKAMEKYTDAVADFGRTSNQARRAKLNLDQAMEAAPRGTRQLLRDTKALRQEWDKLTAPGREGFMQLLLGGVRAGRRIAPFAAGQVNRVARRTGREGTRFADFLAGDVGRRGIQTAAGAYGANIGNVRGAAQGGIEAAVNVAAASRPFLREMTDAIRRWTTGWARSTRDISNTREKIRGMVDHLRSWWRLTRSAGGLLGSLLGAGAGDGQRAVDRLTGQLEEWEQWVRQNPRKVREFFRESVDSSIKLASALGRIAEALWNIGRALTPALDRFSQLVSLAGSAGLLTPGVGAAAFGAFRGIRGGRGGGAGGAAAGGAGGGGMMAALGAAAAAPGAARGTYGLTRAYGYGRMAAAGQAVRATGAPQLLGRVGGTALRGAGKAAWPIAALMAGLDFAGTPGTFGERAQSALSGATFGIVNRPVLGAEARDRGEARADKFVGGLPFGTGGSVDKINARIAGIQGRLGATRTISGGGTEGGGQGYRRTTLAVEGSERKGLVSEMARLREAVRLNTAAQRARLADLSRRRAPGIVQDLQAGFRNRNRRPGVSTQDAMHATVGATIGQLGKGRPEGRRIIAQNMLTWAREQARNNPKLLKEYDRLVAGVKRRFSRMGKDISIVNGQILTGSRTEWASISDEISSAARRGVTETSKEFDRLRAKAIGSLKAMGFSDKEARDLFRYMGKGGETAKRARRAARNPELYKNAPAYKGGAAPDRAGDGLGRRIGGPAPEDRNARSGAMARQQGARAGGGGGLMGANPNLQPYADLGASMGLQVTSGARPGAITSSGNTSWHASGHALDISGSPANMMRFFQAMKSQYGPGLEELIYTPGGVGIKNGQPYTYTGQVAADHFDHVHVADKDPSGVASGGMGGAIPGMGTPGGISLKAKQTGLSGVPGAMSGRAMGGIAAGMEQAVNAALGAAGGAPGAAGTYSGGVMTFEQVARLAESVGLPGVAFAQIAKGESGFNPRAVGHDPGGTQGLGLWQITTGFNDDIISRFGGREAMFNPQINAQAAKAIYDRAGIKAWYGTKFLTDPNAHFTGDGPGKNGHTRSVGSAPRSPRAGRMRAAHRGSGGGLINVNFNGSVHVRSDADIDRIAEHVGRKVLHALRGGTSDKALT